VAWISAAEGIRSEDVAELLFGGFGIGLIISTSL
jgi:hypothetical protein